MLQLIKAIDYINIQDNIMSSIKTGTVKWFKKSKGFGFITQDSGSDVFAHFTSIKGSGFKTLIKGQKVEFIVTKGAKGPQAENIVVIKSTHNVQSIPTRKGYLFRLKMFVKRLINLLFSGLSKVKKK